MDAPDTPAAPEPAAPWDGVPQPSAPAVTDKRNLKWLARVGIGFIIGGLTVLVVNFFAPSLLAAAAIFIAPLLAIIVYELATYGDNS